ncbi:MAG TPA: hypothetical protein VJ986_08565 [Gaiellaceae bacterium]|nr:hypothetical protein [Gaiellaceae bacterium]
MRAPAVLVAVAATAVLAMSAAAAPAAAPPGPAHPNPAVENPGIDYTTPLRGPDGNPTTLVPLQKAVISQALADRDYLAYKTRGDLGGFLPAPVGHLALSSGGRAIVGVHGTPQIPHYSKAGHGQINSFAFVGTPTPTTALPDNGQQPVPGIGVPPSNPPAGGAPVPPPNRGFGGTTTTSTTTTGPTPPARTTPSPPPTTSTTATPPIATTTTETTTETTATTTTATKTTPRTTPSVTTTATTTTGTTSGGASCGTTGITITSDHSSCRIYATNMAPGGSASEVMTIRNDTNQAFTVSLQAAGTQNSFWNDLELGVWKDGTAAPNPLPPLLQWTSQANDLGSGPLQPGQTIKYKVELYLPTTAGNADQNRTAVIDLIWRATV